MTKREQIANDTIFKLEFHPSTMVLAFSLLFYRLRSVSEPKWIQLNLLRYALRHKRDIYFVFLFPSGKQ